MRELDYKRGAKAAGPQAMRPVGVCNRNGCGQPTSIQLTIGISPSGARVVTSPGEMINHDWTLRSGYTLTGWVERCGMCFSLERLNDDKRRWREMNPETPYPLPDWRKPPYCYITGPAEFREFFHASIGDIVRGIAA